MPDKAANAEERAKRYSVYLRPWVLDRNDESAAAPHISHLRAEYKLTACVRTVVSSSSDPVHIAHRRYNKNESWC